MYINNQQIELIHDTTLQILQKIGVKFHHKEALDIFRNAGQRVEGETVYIDSKTVEKAIRSCPGKIYLKARSSNNDICLGTGNTYCGPLSGAVYITDQKNNRRKTTSQDYVNFTKLSQSSSMMQLIGGIIVTPSDIPPKSQVAFMMTSLLTLTDKVLWGLALDGSAARESINMARLIYGDEEKPFMMGLANVTTPLMYDGKMVDAILNYVREGQVINISCCGISGYTVPVTMAGTLAVNNAEILAGIVLAQLVKEGAPVIYGNVSVAADMKTMAIASGSPETSVIAQGVAALAKYYNIPCRVSGAFPSAVECDVQSGYESMMSIMSAHMAKADIVVFAAGSLDSFMSASYEKFIIDEEIRSMVLRYMKGIDVNKETLGFEAIIEGVASGSFLDSMHTCMNYRKELFNPLVSNRVSYDNWQVSGETRLMAAKKIWEKRLAEFKVPESAKENSRVLKYWQDNYGEIPNCLKSL